MELSGENILISTLARGPHPVNGCLVKDVFVEIAYLVWVEHRAGLRLHAFNLCARSYR